MADETTEKTLTKAEKAEADKAAKAAAKKLARARNAEAFRCVGNIVVVGKSGERKQHNDGDLIGADELSEADVKHFLKHGALEAAELDD